MKDKIKIGSAIHALGRLLIVTSLPSRRMIGLGLLDENPYKVFAETVDSGEEFEIDLEQIDSIDDSKSIDWTRLAETDAAKTDREEYSTTGHEIKWHVRNIETEIAVMGSCQCSFERATELMGTAKFFRDLAEWKLNFSNGSATRKRIKTPCF